MSDWVRESGGERRRAEVRDSVMNVNSNGSVSIPADVQVFEDQRGVLWFRTDRLEGWAAHHGESPVRSRQGLDRVLVDEVAAELARQGRSIEPLPMRLTNRPGIVEADI